jgi:hypothetical protein
MAICRIIEHAAPSTEMVDIGAAVGFEAWDIPIPSDEILAEVQQTFPARRCGVCWMMGPLPIP